MRWLLSLCCIACLAGSSFWYFGLSHLGGGVDYDSVGLAGMTGSSASALAIATGWSAWVLGWAASPSRSSHPASSVGWKAPRPGGGSMLALSGEGLFEPINLIVSGQSDDFILTEIGFLDYARSIGFSFECLGQHRGGYQQANLGDGKGWESELFELREVLVGGDPGDWIGTCVESFAGGNHFRAWQQNGSEADTGAWFLAVSKEKSLRFSHTIIEDGYNIGRDLMVAAALQPSCWDGRCWQGTVLWADDLLAPGSDGINHGISQDGRVAVLLIEETFHANRGAGAGESGPAARERGAARGGMMRPDLVQRGKRIGDDDSTCVGYPPRRCS